MSSAFTKIAAVLENYAIPDGTEGECQSSISLTFDTAITTVKSSSSVFTEKNYVATDVTLYICVVS